MIQKQGKRKPEPAKDSSGNVIPLPDNRRFEIFKEWLNRDQQFELEQQEKLNQINLENAPDELADYQCEAVVVESENENYWESLDPTWEDYRTSVDGDKHSTEDIETKQQSSTEETPANNIVNYSNHFKLVPGQWIHYEDSNGIQLQGQIVSISKLGIAINYPEECNTVNISPSCWNYECTGVEQFKNVKLFIQDGAKQRPDQWKGGYQLIINKTKGNEVELIAEKSLVKV